MESTTGIGEIVAIIFVLLAVVFFIYCMWKLFEKANRPGWECLIPFYNYYIIITKIAKKEWWWLLFMFIPILSIVGTIVISLEVAKNFGKGTGFGLGLAFLSPIFYPILALGDAVFEGGDLSIEDNLIEA